MKAIDRFDYVISKNKRHPNNQEYFYSGVFSRRKGVEIKLGNIYQNILDLSNEIDFDEDYVMWAINRAILHEELHRVMDKYIGTNACDCIDSAFIHKYVECDKK